MSMNDRPREEKNETERREGTFQLESKVVQNSGARILGNTGSQLFPKWTLGCE